MKCEKDKTLVLGLLFTVILAVSGILIDNSYNQVDATNELKANYDERYYYFETNVKDDIAELKQDIKEIKNFLIYKNS